MGELDVKMPRKLGALGRWMTSELEKTRSTTIEDANEPLQSGELEFFSFHINQAIRSIASLTRPYELDEMFDKMFGQFCLGK